MSNNGGILRGWQQLQEYFITSFQNLFKSFDNSFPHNLEGLIQHVISKEENRKLIGIPLAKEIWETLKVMPNSKALGLNGFNSLLYKKC